MKRLIFSFASVIVLASFLLQGCTIRFVTNTQATPVPYPNAWHIETRVRAQINRISTGLQQGSLSQDSANVLAENDALVRRMAREYQGPPAAKVDLDGNQTVFLDNMLNDNDRYINDAFQRNQAWVSAFQNGGFDYTSSDRTLFIVSLDYQLNRQQADVDSGLKYGRLTRPQADEFRNRIKVIRELRYNDYRSNGRIDLSEEQVRQLSQMTEDNARYLRYRLKGSRGRWNREQFNTWKTKVPAGLSNGGHIQWGRNPHDDGAHAQDSVNQNAVNPHGKNGSTNSTNASHTGSVQIAQPTHVLPTPTPTMVPRNSVQSQPVVSTPVPVSNLGQTAKPTAVAAAPTDTPAPKQQAPVLVPTNTPAIILNPVLTPTPQVERPKATPAKVPVKVQPTLTPSSKKDDRVKRGNAHQTKEKGNENVKKEESKESNEGDQKRKTDTDASTGDNSGSNSKDDKGNDHGDKHGNPHGQ